MHALLVTLVVILIVNFNGLIVCLIFNFTNANCVLKRITIKSKVMFHEIDFIKLA